LPGVNAARRHEIAAPCSVDGDLRRQRRNPRPNRGAYSQRDLDDGTGDLLQRTALEHRVDQPAERDEHREPTDPEQRVDRVAHAQRRQLPGLLEQTLHDASEAQDREQQEDETQETEARARVRGRRQDVPDRVRAVSGQVVALDYALGGALAPER
jgi:hypothetical protein